MGRRPKRWCSGGSTVAGVDHRRTTRVLATLFCVVAVVGVVPTTTASAAGDADIGISVFSAPPAVATGGSYFRAMTVSNNGPEPATGVEVVDTLPPGATFVSVLNTGSPAAECSAAAGVVTCTIASALRGSVFFGIQIVAPSTPGTYTSVVSVTANEPDPNPINNSASESIDVGGADLQIQLPNVPPVGDDEVLHRVAVFNPGPDAAADAVLTAQLPATYSLASYLVVEGSGTCSEVAGLVTCELGPIAVSGFARLELRTTTDLPPSAPFDVTYAVSSTTLDHNLRNNVAIQTVPVDPVVSIGDASAYEGDAGKTFVKLPVRLTEPSDTEVTLTYRIQGDPSDVNDRRGRSGTVRFRPSAKTGLTPVTKYITVAIRPDVVEEIDETFQVVLSNPTGGVVIGDPVGVGTIINDDVGSGLRIGVGDITFREGDEGVVKASLVVTLSEPATSVVTATAATVASGSVAGVDFTPLTKTLTFLPGQQRKVVTVTLYPDRIDDGNNRTSLVLSDVVGAAIEGSGTGRITTIADD